MTRSCQIIVLHSTKVGEKSLVLHCLSREWGRRSFMVSASHGNLFAPLNILDAEISENPKSDLWRARNLTPVHPLTGIRENLQKTAISLFVSEVLYRTVKDNANEEGLFEFVKKNILLLDSMQGDWSNFHLHWLLGFAAALGYAPDTESLAPFAGEDFARISFLLSHSFPECMMLPLNGEQRGRIAQAILKYISYHSESAVNLRSLGVLNELFR